MILKRKKIPILDIWLIVFIYKEPDEVYERFPLYIFDPPINDSQAFAFEIDGKIHIGLQDDGKITHGIIAHECLHAVNKIFLLIGQKLDLENDEFEAYLLGWMVDLVHRVFNER